MKTFCCSFKKSGTAFFIHECHQWKRKSGKETKLYFIDRNDFSEDTIKMYRVYCQDASYYMNQIIDELDF